VREEPSAQRAVVITVSDRAAAGVYPDRSGPLARDTLTQAGFTVDLTVVPDGTDTVAAALTAALATAPDLLLTLGGTGIGPRDQTPEATRPLLDRELPGVAELLRLLPLVDDKASITSVLSRGLAGVAGQTLVVNLPGSPKAVTESMEALLLLVPHIIDQLHGGDHS
jgi:molybdenum cofactor synthesis domain-containing protein